MDLEQLILKYAHKKPGFSSRKISKKFGYSPAYASRILQKLVDSGQLYKTGSTKNSRYFSADEESIKKAKQKVRIYNRVLSGKAGHEVSRIKSDEVLNDAGKKLSFDDLPENVNELFNYAFTQMLGNAIEHSGTRKLLIKAEKKEEMISFEIRDHGIGIFNNIKQKLSLVSDEEAIGGLIKGKLTASGKDHPGEGLFFTSKCADTLIIQSGTKKIVFNNLLDDIFIRTVQEYKGTKVMFNLNKLSTRNLSDIFNKYSGTDNTFNTTRVAVKLFVDNSKHISRSRAGRALSGMEKFKTVILDFSGIQTIGQGFADEVFRVWKAAHPGIEIKTENANDDVMFMIKHTEQNNRTVVGDAIGTNNTNNGG